MFLICFLPFSTNIFLSLTTFFAKSVRNRAFLLNFVGKSEKAMPSKMKFSKKLHIRNSKISAKTIGLPLVYIGAVALIVCVLTGFTKNFLLIISASIIIVGVVFHVYALKHESKY